MRTTVTLEKDVERMLQQEMHRTRQSFKKTLNAALRAGLTAKTTKSKITPFKVKARAMGLRAGVDPASFNKLTDELEVDAFAVRNKRRRS